MDLTNTRSPPTGVCAALTKGSAAGGGNGLWNTCGALTRICSTNAGSRVARSNHSVMTPNTKSSLTGLGAPSWADRLVSHLVTGSTPTDDQQNEDPSIWVRKFCSEVGCDVLKKQDTNGKTLLHHLLSGKNSLFSGT